MIAIIALVTVSAMPGLAQESQGLNISLKNGVVSPTQLKIAAGATVKINVTNEGDATAEFESKPLHIEKVLPPGASATITLRGLETGAYEFVDEYTEDRPTAHGFIVAE